MKLPPKGRRVLAWVEDEEFPFIGYWDDRFDEEGIWKMDVLYLNCDTHRNDIFGEVISWVEIQKKPEL